MDQRGASHFLFLSGKKRFRATNRRFATYGRSIMPSQRQSKLALAFRFPFQIMLCSPNLLY
jgi:hypothetical protein